MITTRDRFLLGFFFFKRSSKDEGRKKQQKFYLLGNEKGTKKLHSFLSVGAAVMKLTEFFGSCACYAFMTFRPHSIFLSGTFKFCSLGVILFMKRLLYPHKFQINLNQVIPKLSYFRVRLFLKK